MKINFKKLSFSIEDKKIRLIRCGHSEFAPSPFVEIQISGEHKDTHLGAKMVNSSERNRLLYVSHSQTENELTIIQRSELVEVAVVFTSYQGTDAVRVHTEVTNISDERIVLEEVSAFTYTGLGNENAADSTYFTRFIQSHHFECQPLTHSFEELGFIKGVLNKQKRIAFSNIGSWSTKEELPQGIIENREASAFTMFQIESCASWYYEIADIEQDFYLYLGGANLPFGGWSKALESGESYTTVNAALAFSDTLGGVIDEITKYRRHIAGKCIPDEHLPAIFNEYMHLSWDTPGEDNTKKIVPTVAKTGVEYYVIDCGWHNEEPTNGIYLYVGQWRESRARFPSGIRAITDYIRSFGLKAGLWIEPEVIGINCREMLDYYSDDCFLQRNGKRITVMGRHFLDFRAPKVVEYMNETIRRMVEDYGAEYIKFDYNQDAGVGTDYLALCAGEGLELAAEAYLKWVSGIRERFPNVLFEACASGGMRMDYLTLSHFSILSTSDQVDYLKYPYVVGNVLSAVIPEQAAVWSYPVSEAEMLRNYSEAWVNANMTDERVALNMINSFLGRIHLASHLELLSKSHLALVREGVDYYNSLSSVKKNAAPYFPMGFARYGDDSVVAGIKADGKIYLAVWGLKTTEVKVDIPNIGRAKIAYPVSSKAKLSTVSDGLAVSLPCKGSAVFVEIDEY